jgi:hypothetical protein
MKNKKILSYFLIVLSLILLLINLFRLDYNNLLKNHFFGIISNVLLIIAMLLNIRSMKNAEKEEKIS